MEQFFDIVLFNANARVLYRNGQLNMGVVFAAITYTQGNTALFRVFHRIGEDIGHHLPQTDFIPL